MPTSVRLLAGLVSLLGLTGFVSAADHLRELQLQSASQGKPIAAHWGPDHTKYISWSSHSS